MRTIAPKTTCAKPIISATYPTRLTVSISMGPVCVDGGHLVRTVIHRHVMISSLDSPPGKEQQDHQRDRGHSSPNQLCNWRTSGNQIRMLRASLLDERSKNRDLGHC